ncbi:MAG: hypothetical protein Q8P48_01480 [Deltaproteobacteria bacterium]|nr:hypothetical protein [Deltaproteobacteria bacterium]
MTGGEGLKKSVYYHAIAGAVFSALLFAALILAGYRDGLIKAEDSLVRIRRNLVSMEAATVEMRSKKALVGSVIPAGYGKRSNREIMLLTLEKVREGIPGAKVTVTGFVEEGGELSLPVVIEFPVYDYHDAVRGAAWLEGLRFPYFKVRGASVRRTEGKADAEGRIDGSFRMPAERPGMGEGEGQR